MLIHLADIGPRSNKTGSKSVKNGMKTLRFRANESAVVENVDAKKVAAQNKINQLLENFIGINDEHLGKPCFTRVITQITLKSRSDSSQAIIWSLLLASLAASLIYDLGITQSNTLDFAEALDDSDLGAFGFTDDFIFEMWGAITDVKSGRV